MPARGKKKGPRVRGICPAGHVVETDAEPGRITWRGPCPVTATKGGPPCGLHVMARRVAGDEPPPSSPLEPRPAGTPGRTVRKASAYRDDDPAKPGTPGFALPEPKHPGNPAAGGAPPDTDPPGGAPRLPVDPAAGAPGSGHDDDVGTGGSAPIQRRPNLLERLRQRSEARRREFDDDARNWSAPGVYR